VPFFFSTPAAWCTGRGEQVTPTPLGATLTFVLACPAAGLKTADVYRACRVPAKPKNGEEIRQAVAAGDVPAIGRSLWNRLQEAAEALQPAVVTARKRLETIGLPSTLMSGSGSAVFALCRDQEADRVIEKLDHGPEEGFSVFVVRSCT
jgi:4-diphosphocytidyl-2-C-methyl-D-erythritol kinase